MRPKVRPLMRALRGGRVGRRVLLGVAGVASVTACRPASETDVANGDDPIAALGTHVPSSRYGGPFWGRVAQTDPALWMRALKACGGADASEHPACADVKAVEMYKAMSTPAPRRAPTSFKVP